mmetsp:Transcript_28277/g.86457  ORF Transcript_28277/g.86457 Transcript_28277/m.86457 type:complete len:203 (+) Transcript_28277:3705-4313(+)
MYARSSPRLGGSGGDGSGGGGGSRSTRLVGFRKAPPPPGEPKSVRGMLLLRSRRSSSGLGDKAFQTHLAARRTRPGLSATSQTQTLPSTSFDDDADAESRRPSGEPTRGAASRGDSSSSSSTGIAFSWGPRLRSMLRSSSLIARLPRATRLRYRVGAPPPLSSADHLKPSNNLLEEGFRNTTSSNSLLNASFNPFSTLQNPE